MHTVFHEKDDIRLPKMGICNCCWDCCGLFGSYNRGLLPLAAKKISSPNQKESNHLSWLAEIGFVHVDIIWKHYKLAVYGGIKTT